MENMTITPEQIETAASEMSQVTDYGFANYIKVNGAWELESMMIVEKDFRRTYKVYPDARPMEIINWA